MMVIIHGFITKINIYVENYLIFVIMNSCRITFVRLSNSFHDLQFEGRHFDFVEEHVYLGCNNIGLLKIS